MDRKRSDTKAGGMTNSLVDAYRYYVNKVIETSGMKVLLLDKETTSMVGIVYPLSEIISHDVYLVQSIAKTDQKTSYSDSPTEEESATPMTHLKACVFVRPTQDSVDHIIAHLRNPKYKEYHLFFSNILAEPLLRELAKADTFEVVRSVREFFGDYHAIDSGLFHVNARSCRDLHEPKQHWSSKELELFRRNIDGVLAVLLSLKRRPVLRYQRSSNLAKLFAQTVSRRMKEEASMFHFPHQSSAPLLLVLDRRDDPVTPLLNQWTYQAMVHELLGIEDNRVDMRAVPGIHSDLRQIVLSAEQDHFFKGSMYLNFGDLGVSVKDLVQNYQRKTKNSSKIDTIEDMQRFVDQYPEFRQMAGNVSKHVAVMTELSRLVNLHSLMRVSEREQELACTQDHSEAVENTLRLLEDGKVKFHDKVRLVLLYALRYENDRNQVPTMVRILEGKAGNSEEKRRVQAVDEMLRYAGSGQRGGDLFGNKSLLAKASSFFTSGLKGVDNIYTQHNPLLATTLDLLAKGKLKNTEFPFVDGSNSRGRDEMVIVYLIGGTTYEEAAAVHRFNDSNPGVQVILGGSCIHNSKSFLKDVLREY